MIRTILICLGLLTAHAAMAQSNLPLVIQNGQTRQLPAGTTLAVQPSTSGTASINIPAGAAPSSPNNGDCWVTSTGTFCRNGGVTRGPVAIKEPAAVNIYVDSVAGTDSATCGTGTGALACKTLPQTARNLCVNYDHTGVPVINGVSGQTYTAGLQFKGGFAGAASTAICDGIPTVIFDGHGSSIASADSGAVMLYYAPMTLYVKNVALSVTSVNGAPVLVRGAGVVILAEGVTLGQAATNWPQAWAYGGGQIATCPISVCPSNTVLNVTGGGTAAFLATEAGGIQVEGANLNITGTPAYTLAFAVAKNNGVVAFAGTTISGAATGDQFNAALGGSIQINAQTGGYSACAANTYLPGSQCGQKSNTGWISEPGVPTVTGCGTGCIVQNSERAVTVVFGTGLGSTLGTRYGPARLTFATRSNYQSCAVTPSDPAIDRPQILMGPPAGSANGYVDIYWLGNGSSPASKAVYVSCQNN